MREEAAGMALPPEPRGVGSNLLHSDPGAPYANDDDFDPRRSSVSTASPGYFSDRNDGTNSPFVMSPWNQTTSSYNSPWTQAPFQQEDNHEAHGLIGSLVREEGHIYSLAATGDLLYTGSDSKNIRVWKNREEYGGFKSHSGLVKAIIISGEKIFTGHQDGRIRVWQPSPKKPGAHKRVGTLPTTRALLKCSLNPSNYVEIRRHRSALWIKHHDAVSCLSISEDQGILYSGSWDRTVKVWRVSDSKCLESIRAHEDAVNSVVAAPDGLVFTGSADGTVKVWRREAQGKTSKHALLQTLLAQECAVTALVASPSDAVLYCGSSDGMINFWDREKQLSHGGVLKAHKLAVLCLAAAGCLVFSGSADKSICVWRRDGGVHSCLSVLHGHEGPVKCIAAEADQENRGSSDGDQRWILYTGSLDKSVKVWRVSEVPPEMGQWTRGPAPPEEQPAPFPGPAR
ncbi:unnamed protein product [Victoria cruziana]